MPLFNCRTADVITVTSTDGGMSYAGAKSNFQHFNERAPGGNLRAATLGARFAVDAAGTIYAAWTDCWFRFRLEGECTHNDISFSTSQDGRHWTDKVRIPIDPVRSSADHFLSDIAVEPETSGASAHIAIVYYFQPKQWCNPHTCQDYVGLATSLDGGSTWDLQQLAGPFKNTWFPLTASGYMIGEYVGIGFVKGNAVPVFPVASKGRCKLGEVTSCNEWIAAATVPIGQ